VNLADFFAHHAASGVKLAREALEIETLKETNFMQETVESTAPGTKGSTLVTDVARKNCETCRRWKPRLNYSVAVHTLPS